MVSAWSSQHKLVPGARAVNEESNETAAIPDLLELLAIKGAIVTIDAMGCQKKIAGRIIGKGADHGLGLKGNQGSLRDDVELLFDEQMAGDFKDIDVSRTDRKADAGHGRIETRHVLATRDVGWLKKRHDWSGLDTVAMALSTRETQRGVERQRGFSISSLPANAEEPANAIRAHWGIENALHWVLDVNFRDDDCRIRKKNAPANLTTIKRAALNALKNAPSRESVKSKRLIAGWDNEVLERTLRCL